MPFTFSHPAIVLPLTSLPKRCISVTGFVIGSLTPDFEYFIRMKVKSEYSHTISGLFWFDFNTINSKNECLTHKMTCGFDTFGSPLRGFYGFV